MLYFFGVLLWFGITKCLHRNKDLEEEKNNTIIFSITIFINKKKMSYDTLTRGFPRWTAAPAAITRLSILYRLYSDHDYE